METYRDKGKGSKTLSSIRFVEDDPSEGGIALQATTIEASLGRQDLPKPSNMEPMEEPPLGEVKHADVEGLMRVNAEDKVHREHLPSVFDFDLLPSMGLGFHKPNSVRSKTWQQHKEPFGVLRGHRVFKIVTMGSKPLIEDREGPRRTSQGS